jgi:catechol 2,3-dioxygenase-like lactoylglutathione lyase family enzyme
MLHHLSFGVRNLQIAGKFYDAVLGSLGYRRVFEDDTAIGYGIEDDQDIFCLKFCPATQVPGEGFHLAFNAISRVAVDNFYQQALQTGGLDNGCAGLRLDYGDHYYAAFVIDPDGYRIEAVCKQIVM